MNKTRFVVCLIAGLLCMAVKVVHCTTPGIPCTQTTIKVVPPRGGPCTFCKTVCPARGDKCYRKNTAQDLFHVGSTGGGVRVSWMVRKELTEKMASKQIFRRKGRKPRGKKNISDKGNQVFQVNG